MPAKLDHILLGAPDLDAGTAVFAALTGVQPVTGGTHPGFGTRNRLASLGPDVFFEVIAPDPAQQIRGLARAEVIAALPYPRLLTFAIQTGNIGVTCAKAEAAGLTVTTQVPMHRTRPDGVRLDWTVAHFAHPNYGDVIPFAIDWQGSPHPAGTAPGGCRLKSLAVLHPSPIGLASIYWGLEIDIPVKAGVRPGFIVVLDTPKGEVCFLGG